MEQDFDQAFRVIAVNDDGGDNALLPGALDETKDARLVALEPAPLALERHQDEGLEVPETIIDDAVDLAGERGMPVILVAEQPGPDSGLGRGNGVRVAAERVNPSGELLQIPDKHGMPAIVRFDRLLDPAHDRQDALLR